MHFHKVGPLLVVNGVITSINWPCKWVIGVISYNSTYRGYNNSMYNPLVGPPCMTLVVLVDSWKQGHHRWRYLSEILAWSTTLQGIQHLAIDFLATWMDEKGVENMGPVFLPIRWWKMRDRNSSPNLGGHLTSKELPGLWVFHVFLLVWMKREKNTIGNSSHHGKNPFVNGSPLFFLLR